MIEVQPSASPPEFPELELFQDYFDVVGGLPLKAINLVVQSTLQVMLTLLDIFDEQDRDPIPVLDECFSRQIEFLEGSKAILPHLVEGGTTITSDGIDMEELFESAWTTYSAATFDDFNRSDP